MSNRRCSQDKNLHLYDFRAKILPTTPDSLHKPRMPSSATEISLDCPAAQTMAVTFGCSVNAIYHFWKSRIIFLIIKTSFGHNCCMICKLLDSIWFNYYNNPVEQILLLRIMENTYCFCQPSIYFFFFWGQHYYFLRNHSSSISVYVIFLRLTPPPALGV